MGKPQSSTGHEPIVGKIVPKLVPKLVIEGGAITTNIRNLIVKTSKLSFCGMWKSHIQIVQKFNLNNILNLYFF